MVVSTGVFFIDGSEGKAYDAPLVFFDIAGLPSGAMPNDSALIDIYFSHGQEELVELDLPSTVFFDALGYEDDRFADIIKQQPTEATKATSSKRNMTYKIHPPTPKPTRYVEKISPYSLKSLPALIHGSAKIVTKKRPIFLNTASNVSRIKEKNALICLIPI